MTPTIEMDEAPRWMGSYAATFRHCNRHGHARCGVPLADLPLGVDESLRRYLHRCAPFGGICSSSTCLRGFRVARFEGHPPSNRPHELVVALALLAALALTAWFLVALRG